MTVVEIRPHEWTDNRGRRCRADYFPFVDGKPRYDLDCEKCKHFQGYGNECVKWMETGGEGDDLIYNFCGPICGYFEMDEQEAELGC